MESFSDAQLDRMRDAGVRLWPQGSGLPPDVTETGATPPPVGSPAGYLPGARTLRYGPDTSVGAFRHELAHAWDDVGGEHRTTRLDEMPLAERTRTVERLAREDAGGRALGSDRDAHLRDAFEDYRGSRHWTSDARDREAFDASARAGYSTRSVEEFYAEGFNAFHNDAEHAARIERNAPELYRRLAEESRAAGTLPAWVNPETLAIE